MEHLSRRDKHTAFANWLKAIARTNAPEIDSDTVDGPNHAPLDEQTHVYPRAPSLTLS